jgi:hypothetical protein
VITLTAVLATWGVCLVVVMRAAGEMASPDRSPRPLWRWWLWCAVNELHIRVRWRWVQELWSWLIVPAWLGDFEAPVAGEEEPF